MIDLALDIRYAWRRLLAAPSFAIIAIGTLAVGIGVTTAVYSLIYAMMLRPMNITDIDRVVNIDHSGGTSGPRISFSSLDYEDLKAQQTSFEALASWTRIRGPLTGRAPAEMVLAEAVEGTYFALLGVPAALGRTIGSEDDKPSAPPVAVLSDRLWRRRYGADPGIIGQIVKLRGHSVEVIGVAAPWFRGVDMPNVNPTALWVPIAHHDLFSERADRTSRNSRWLRVKARLAAGTTIEEARAEVSAIAGRLDQAFPGPSDSSRRGRERAGWRVVPAASVQMHESIDRLGVPISRGLMAALALVLLIACVNIANLLLARGAGRHGEMATRVAIGASRIRLLRQLLTENALLCALGGALGLFVAFVLTRFMTMQVNMGRGFSFAFEPRIEWPVLLISIGATAMAGLVFGLAPAVQGARIDVRAAMAGAVRFKRHRISPRRMLLIFQLAMSVAFLVVGSAFLKGFARYARHDPGFDVSQTALAGFELEYRWKDDRDTARRFLRRLRDEAREQPGTTAAAIISALPVGNPGPRSASVETEDAVFPPPGEPRPWSSLLFASPEALQVLGIELVRGRFFNEQDTAASSPVAVLSEGTARLIFGTPDVVGRRMRFLLQAYASEGPPQEVVATVVGVTRDTDVGVIGRRETGRGLMFVPFEQHHAREFSVAVRTSGDPAAAASALSVLARRLDEEVVTYVSTGRSVMSNEVLPTRVGAAVAGGLGGLAFLLAIVGLYGVMSHLVAMRTREIGIRMALGAEAIRVVRLILKEGVSLVIAGAMAGALLAYWIVGFLRRLIFGLDAQEPFALATVTVVLGLAALVACWIPARRASRVDPNVALRHL